MSSIDRHERFTKSHRYYFREEGEWMRSIWCLSGGDGLGGSLSLSLHGRCCIDRPWWSCCSTTLCLLASFISSTPRSFTPFVFKPFLQVVHAWHPSSSSTPLSSSHFFMLSIQSTLLLPLFKSFLQAVHPKYPSTSSTISLQVISSSCPSKVPFYILYSSLFKLFIQSTLLLPLLLSL